MSKLVIGQSGWQPGSIKVAVASSDGRFINQHFGRAKQFLVFTIRDDCFEFLEVRANVPPCDDHEHDDDRLKKAVDLISDCQMVLVSQIGPGAAQTLLARGIQPYVIPDFIEDALNRLIV